MSAADRQEHVTVNRLRSALPALVVLPGAVERLLVELHDLMDPESREAAIDSIARVEAMLEELDPILRAAGTVARDIHKDALLPKLKVIADAADEAVRESFAA